MEKTFSLHKNLSVSIVPSGTCCALHKQNMMESFIYLFIYFSMCKKKKKEREKCEFDVSSQNNLFFHIGDHTSSLRISLLRRVTEV